jgi:membrane protein
VGNLITNKARDLAVLFTLGLGIAIFAVWTSAVGAGAGQIAQWLGLSGQGWIPVLAGFAVSVVADTALMIILLRVVSGLLVPWRDLSQGALLGGVGLSLLKLSAATLLPRLTANPLFASFAIAVGLLVWLNLIARLTLISAAWAANDVDELHGDAVRAQIEALSQGAEAGTDTRTPMTGTSGGTAVRDRSLPTFGARSGDRTTLGAGVILGACAMAATGALVRGIRSVARLVRG